MTPAMAAALSSGRAMATVLFQFDLPSGVRRLMLGAGEVAWGGDTFKGFLSDFGHVSGGDDVSEDVTGQAPNTSITVIPSPDADRDDIAGPEVQLSRAQMWLAVLQLDGSSHLQVLPDPEPVFDGFVDQATINLDEKRDDIDYTLLSGFDYFFEDSEGERLNGQFQRSMFAGELGLENVTGITQKVYWGAAAPPGSQSQNSGGLYYGGGSGGPFYPFAEAGYALLKAQNGG